MLCNIMNLLFVIPYTPTSIRTRPHNLLKGLIAAGHHVTLATLWETDEERLGLDEFADAGVKVIAVPLNKIRTGMNMLKAVALRQPLQAYYSWQPKLRTLLQKEVFDAGSIPDVIHVEHLRGACYALWLAERTNHPDQKIPIVWDAVDSISYLFDQARIYSRSRFGRWISKLELKPTRRLEGKLVSKFDRVIVTSAADKAAMLELAGKRSQTIRVLPNGVALDFFHPGDRINGNHSIVFTGKMSYHANHTAAMYLLEDIMPLVWQRAPEARVWIVGKKPSDSLLERGQSDRRIHVTGSVPEILPYIQEATVAVAPMLYGAGIQNKVLEAMACHIPVVATNSATAALTVEDGTHLLLGNSAEAFANAIVRLLYDPRLRQRIASQGYQYVNKNHDWPMLIEQFVAIYSEVCKHAAE